jgi:hypothetical protein
MRSLQFIVTEWFRENAASTTSIMSRALVNSAASTHSTGIAQRQIPEYNGKLDFPSPAELLKKNMNKPHRHM